MLEVPVYNTSGEQVETLQIAEDRFGKTVNATLLKQAIVAYHANKRQGTATTKGRSQVVGSSRKLFRQKGTGRARRGNIRTNVLRGGGVAFAKTAREEGFEAVALVLEAVSVAEKQHEKRFRGVLANVEAETVFMKDESVVWRCRNCGYVHEGNEAPGACPACAHPQAHFELLAENW